MRPCIIALGLILLLEWCTQASCHAGHGFFLDGVDDYLEIIMPEALLWGEWTVEYWLLSFSGSGVLDPSRHDCFLHTRTFDGTETSPRVLWQNARGAWSSTDGHLPADHESAVQTHIAMVYSTSNNTVVSYVNGEYIGSAEPPAHTVHAYRQRWQARILVGGCYELTQNNDLLRTRLLQGYIDEVRLWNRALSGDEIRANMYNASESLCCPLLRANADNLTTASEWSMATDPGTGEVVIIAPGSGTPSIPSIVPSPFTVLEGGPVVASLAVGVVSVVDLQLAATYSWLRVDALPANVSLRDPLTGELLANGAGQVVQGTTIALLASVPVAADDVLLLACQIFDDCNQTDSDARSSSTFAQRVVVTAQANVPPVAGALFEIELFGDGDEGGYIEMPQPTASGTVEFWLKHDLGRGPFWVAADGSGARHMFLWTAVTLQMGILVHRSWQGSNKAWQYEQVWSTDLMHLAIVWREVGRREEIWCVEWEPSNPCGNESTPLSWEVWEYHISLYKNGQYEAPTIMAEYPGSNPPFALLRGRMLDPTFSKMTIGSSNAPLARKSGRYSEVRFWSYVRSDAEIASNYQRQMTGEESGLAAYIGPSSEDFGAVPAGFTTAHTAHDLAEEARYANASVNLDDESECSMTPARPPGQSQLLCVAEACGFDYRRGFIVRRSRFPNIQARPLLWEVSAGGSAAILPIPRHDPDDIEDMSVTERPDLLPADTPLQEFQTALVATTGASAQVSIAAGVPASCGEFIVNGSTVSLADTVFLTIGQQLYFQPAPLSGTTTCSFSLSFTVTDASGASGFAPAQVDVRVLPLAPQLERILALDSKPSNRAGLQAEDELHFLFDKPTNKPRVTSVEELLSVFDVSPETSVPTEGFFVACWTGDGRRLILSILDPVEPWSAILSAEFKVRQETVRGTLAEPTYWSQISTTAVAVEHAFDTRPCPGEGDFFDQVSNGCMQCEVGHRLADNGQGCVACSAGSFLDEPTSLDCKPCLPGEYQPLEGQSSCFECAEGQNSETPGAANCSVCTRGSFADVNGSSACLDCPVGFYAPDEGRSQCLPCSQLAAAHEGHPEAWVTMERLLRAGQGLIWVYKEGATNASQCGCDAGFVEFQGHCRECGEGLVCGGMGEMYVEEGYFVAFNSISVFECLGRTKECAGGQPGSTCQEGRTSRACVDCMDGKAPSSGGRCEDCSGAGYGTLVLAAVGMLFALLVLYRVVASQQRALQGHMFLMASICCAHVTTLAQQLSVVSLLSTDFGEPFASFQEFLKIFIFDFAVLGVDCVRSTRASARYCLSLFALAGLLSLVTCIHHVDAAIFHSCNFMKRLPILISAIGTLMLAFYVSVVSTVIQPFVCFEHPNGELTPRAFQSVICYTSGEHTTMIVASCCGFIFPLSFFVVCLWATLRTKDAVRRGQTRFIAAFGFLLNRFTPSAHFFPLWLLFRSFMLALAPIFPRVDLQILMISTLLTVSLLLTAHTRPWRVRFGTEIDLVLTAAVQVVVVIGAILVDDDDVSLRALSIVSLILTLLGFGLAIAVAACALFRMLLSRQKEYQFFLSHHKVGSGATARLLKMSLLDAGARKVFYDSDDLMNLDSLCNKVSHHVETLVLVGSSEVLTRPWCLGELTVARMKKVFALCAAWPDFNLPESGDLEANGIIVQDLDCLHEYEISVNDVKDTLTWVQTLKVIYITACTPGEFSIVAAQLAGGWKTHTSSAGRASNKALETAEHARAETVITADSQNREAGVTALILQKFMRKAAEMNVEKMPNVSLEVDSVDDALNVNAKHLLVLCSTKAFYNPCVAKNLVSSYRRSRILVPAFIDTAFTVPTKLDYEALKASAADVVGDSGAEDDLCHAVRSLFKEIAIPFHYTASELDLASRTIQIYNRLAATAAPRRHNSDLQAVAAKVDNVETFQVEF